jgi:hypothetical protein
LVRNEQIDLHVYKFKSINKLNFKNLTKIFDI